MTQVPVPTASGEKAQQLDPDQLTVKWGYLLKNVYHALGMEDKANAIM